MADLIFVAATFAFFAICVLYVNWCDHIIGPDDFTRDTAMPVTGQAGTDEGDTGSAVNPDSETSPLTEVPV